MIVGLALASLYLGAVPAAGQGPQEVGPAAQVRTQPRVKSNSRARSTSYKIHAKRSNQRARSRVARHVGSHPRSKAQLQRARLGNTTGTRMASRTPSAGRQARPALKPVKLGDVQPKPQPTALPTAQPTAQPMAHPTAQPMANPMAQPTRAFEQPGMNSDQLTKLTVPLRAKGLLPADVELKDACSHFKSVSDCVAALHASHNVGINFNCMKWDLTGVPLTADPASCPTPGSRNFMTLSKAIQALKPEAFGKEEAIIAEKQAHDDLKEVGFDISTGPAN